MITDATDVISQPLLELEPVQNYDSLHYAIIITVLLFVLFVILVVFVYWRKYPETPSWPNLKESVRLIEMHTPKVVIISPYGCNLFMDCLAKFRDVLRSKECQVSTCHFIKLKNSKLIGIFNQLAYYYLSIGIFQCQVWHYFIFYFSLPKHKPRAYVGIIKKFSFSLLW